MKKSWPYLKFQWEVCLVFHCKNECERVTEWKANMSVTLSPVKNESVDKWKETEMRWDGLKDTQMDDGMYQG